VAPLRLQSQLLWGAFLDKDYIKGLVSEVVQSMIEVNCRPRLANLPRRGQVVSGKVMVGRPLCPLSGS